MHQHIFKYVQKGYYLPIIIFKNLQDPPETYLRKLRLFLDPHGAKAARKLDSTSTQILRDLEISLRTNPIEWVREFLGEASRGLDILIEYLSSR